MTDARDIVERLRRELADTKKSPGELFISPGAAELAIAEIEALDAVVAGLHDGLDAKARENASLAAIVDRLPKTADGVPVVPGDLLYVINYSSVVQVAAPTLAIGPEPMEGRTTGLHYPFGRCYSTREAAEAAAKEPKQ